MFYELSDAHGSFVLWNLCLTQLAFLLASNSPLARSLLKFPLRYFASRPRFGESASLVYNQKNYLLLEPAWSVSLCRGVAKCVAYWCLTIGSIGQMDR